MEDNCKRKILITLRQAPQRTQLDLSTLYRLMQSGELASTKVGKKRHIPLVELRALVERHLEVSN